MSMGGRQLLAGNALETQSVWSTDGLKFPKYPGNLVLPFGVSNLSSKGEGSRLRTDWRGPCITVS